MLADPTKSMHGWLIISACTGMPSLRCSDGSSLPVGEQLRRRYESETLHSFHHVRDAELSVRRYSSRVDFRGLPDITRAHDGWEDLSDIPFHGSIAVRCVAHGINLAYSRTLVEAAARSWSAFNCWRRIPATI